MLRDALLVFRRELRLSLRSPAWIAIGLMQPLLYLVLFGPLLDKVVTSTPGFPPGDSWTILTPALVIQLTLFGSSYAGFGLLAELRLGVVERLRVTPASRSGLLLGKVAHVAAQALVQSVLIVLLAIVVFGLDAPIGGMLLSLVIVALTAVTLGSASYAIALRIRDEAAFPALLNAVLLPLLLLSGILLPITSGLAPDWLYVVSRVNPFTHIVDAERASFRGELTIDALFTGCVVLALLTALSVYWGTRTFRRENA